MKTAEDKCVLEPTRKRKRSFEDLSQIEDLAADDIRVSMINHKQGYHNQTLDPQPNLEVD